MNSTRSTWAIDWEAVVWRSIANHGYIIWEFLPLDALEYRLTWFEVGYINAFLILITIAKANNHLEK